MVPEVEELRAELEVAPPIFVQHEVLKEGDVPVVAAGTPHRVARCVAPSARSRGAVDGCVEPLGDRMRIVWSTVSGPGRLKVLGTILATFVPV